jgi:hypothetical protein
MTKPAGRDCEDDAAADIPLDDECLEKGLNATEKNLPRM